MNKKEQKGKLTIIGLIGNIISWTMLVLLVVVATFLLYYIISTQLYATKGEKFAPKYSMYTIVSPSMTPNINVYDVVIDKKVEDFSELQVGDVITFISTSSISNGMTITHRIVDIIETEEGTKYKTKGDNNLTADYSLVTQDKVIGKVKFRIPQLGRVQFFLSSKGGWLIIILIPALIIILSDVFKLFKLVDIKKRVKNVEEGAKEEEQTLKEQREEELRKQQELKEKLQAKNNDISLETKEVIKEESSIVENYHEYINTEEEKEKNMDNELINDNVDEYINSVESELKEKEDSELKVSTPDVNLDSLKALLSEDDEEEIELPKAIQIKEEEIPDDLDLPIAASREEELKEEKHNESEEGTLESVIDEYITKERIINVEDIELEENKQKRL